MSLNLGKGHELMSNIDRLIQTIDRQPIDSYMIKTYEKPKNFKTENLGFRAVLHR